jgi:hypothetical protein
MREVVSPDGCLWAVYDLTLTYTEATIQRLLSYNEAHRR